MDGILAFEKAGLKIIGMKMQWINKEHAQKHYSDDITKRNGEHVRNMLLDFITSGPIIAAVIEGDEVVEVVRKIVGSTEPKSAQPGTIRGDYCHMNYGLADSTKRCVPNVIHASGNKEEAKQEVALWFSDKELHTYRTVHEIHVM